MNCGEAFSPSARGHRLEIRGRQSLAASQPPPARSTSLQVARIVVMNHLAPSRIDNGNTLHKDHSTSLLICNALLTPKYAHTRHVCRQRSTTEVNSIIPVLHSSARPTIKSSNASRTTASRPVLRPDWLPEHLYRRVIGRVRILSPIHLPLTFVFFRWYKQY